MTRRVMTTFCIIAAIFVLSNGICYAATGETWVNLVFTTTTRAGVKDTMVIDSEEISRWIGKR